MLPDQILDKSELQTLQKHQLIELLEVMNQRLRKANLALAKARAAIGEYTRALSQNTNAIVEKNRKIKSLSRTVVKRRKRGQKPAVGVVDWQNYFEKTTPKQR